MSLLSKLTIVIMTYNRPRYALRNMRLWSGACSTVHVLDGSPEPMSPEQLDSLASNIHYQHMPESYLVRFSRIPALVDTEYAVLLGDDDFLVPSALKASISELESNKKLVACCGRSVDKVLASDLVVHWSAISTNRSNYLSGASGAIDLEDPVERMIFHMDPYSPTIIYSVCRTRAWGKAIRLLSARQYSSGHVGELQFELSMSFSGKTRVLDQLMSLRSAENDMNTSGFELAFHEWYSDPRYMKEVEDFLNTTASDLADTSKLGFETIRRGLKLACEAYVAWCEGRYLKRLPNDSASGPRERSAPAASTALKVLFRRFISGLPAPAVAALPSRLRFRPYADIAKELESAGLRVDWDQLSTILESVRKFHDAESEPLHD